MGKLTRTEFGLVRKTTLTDAQIKTLPTAPGMELVPSPGLGKALLFHKAFCLLDTLAGVYAADADSALWIIYGTGVAASSVFRAEAALEFAGQQPFVLDARLTALSGGTFDKECVSQVSGDISDFEDKALNLADTYASVNNYTLGNVLNSLQVTVFYSIVPLV